MEDNVAGCGFHGVYLLYCMNPRFKGHTYIGYTVNPNRRIKQHNGGVDKGGAHKTSRKRPWNMILIVHGFPSDIVALQFEWAWQNPFKSRRLKHALTGKKSREHSVSYCFRVLSELLRVGPWNRLPLTIRWLMQEYEMDFDPLRQPPMHIPIVHGLLVSEKNKKKTQSENNDKCQSQNVKCTICSKKIKAEEKPLRCPKPDCNMAAHILCLAKTLLKNGHEQGMFCLPVDGHCPSCQNSLLWRDLVRPAEGAPGDDDGMVRGDVHWTEQLKQQ